jgi:hypothetical protein
LVRSTGHETTGYLVPLKPIYLHSNYLKMQVDTWDNTGKINCNKHHLTRCHNHILEPPSGTIRGPHTILPGDFTLKYKAGPSVLLNRHLRFLSVVEFYVRVSDTPSKEQRGTHTLTHSVNAVHPFCPPTICHIQCWPAYTQDQRTQEFL